MLHHYFFVLIAALVTIVMVFPQETISQKIKAVLFGGLTLLLTAFSLITPIGVGLLCVVGLAMHLTTKTNLPIALRIVTSLIAILFIFAIPLKTLPLTALSGFPRIHIDAPEFLGTATAPFRVDISYAKCMLGLLILLLWVKPECSAKDIKQKMFSALPLIVLLPTLIILFANQLGWKFDVKWYGFSLYYIIGNFCLTVVAEEVLFRATLQYHFARFLERHTAYGWIISLLVVSIFFGMLHLGGGQPYAFLATLSGVAYGWVYWRYQSLHSAIACHLLVNTLHFVFLVYPK